MEAGKIGMQCKMLSQQRGSFLSIASMLISRSGLAFSFALALAIRLALGASSILGVG
jgi:hypothetical protein